MTHTPEPLPEQTFVPTTDSGPLPPLPDSAYPPDAIELPYEGEPDGVPFDHDGVQDDLEGGDE